MRILEHGQYYEKGPITCAHCGCKFMYDCNDIIRTEQYTLSTINFTPYVICPDCGANIYVSESNTYYFTTGALS